MLESIVLTESEFRSLKLRMTGSYHSAITYATDEEGVTYLLKRDYEEGVGVVYKGSRLVKKEVVSDEKFIISFPNKHRPRWDGDVEDREPLIVKKSPVKIIIDKEEGTVEYEERRLNRPGGGGW